MDVSDWPAGIDLNPILFRLTLASLVQQQKRPDILFRLRRKDDRFFLDLHPQWEEPQCFDISALVSEVGLPAIDTVNALVETTLIHAGRADLIDSFGRL
jgi:hypothetical protein